MDRLVVIRQTSVAAGRELLRTSIMSQINSAFFNFLFKEIILQLMVLLSAVSFIFFGFPVGWCLATIPIVAVLVYVSTYSYHAMKAFELTSYEPMSCWIAEVFEPYLMTADPQDFSYNIVTEAEFNQIDFNSRGLQKKVIGIVMVRDHFGPVNSLWMYGLAVDTKYHRKGIGRMLIKNAYLFTKQRGYDSLEVVITDLQNEVRLVLLAIGFRLKNIYHKRILGFVPLGKYQMGISTI